ncbi:MAG TPA: RNA-binding protein [Firmicutes bacterium]|nr:RNA-binding protein [Bacillota bacterium]
MNIYVGNLSYQTNETAVKSLFEAYGTVTEVNIITDRDTGQTRGFGFVEMANDAEALNAIAEINGKELDGRVLKVNEARPKTERRGGPRSGGGDRKFQRRNRY